MYRVGFVRVVSATRLEAKFLSNSTGIQAETIGNGLKNFRNTSLRPTYNSYTCCMTCDKTATWDTLLNSDFTQKNYLYVNKISSAKIQTSWEVVSEQNHLNCFMQFDNFQLNVLFSRFLTRLTYPEVS